MSLDVASAYKHADMLWASEDRGHETMLEKGKNKLEDMHIRLAGFLNDSIMNKDKPEIQIKRQTSNSCFESAPGMSSIANRSFRPELVQRIPTSIEGSLNLERRISQGISNYGGSNLAQNQGISGGRSSTSGEYYKATKSIKHSTDESTSFQSQQRSLEYLEDKIRALQRENTGFTSRPQSSSGRHPSIATHSGNQTTNRNAKAGGWQSRDSQQTDTQNYMNHDTTYHRHKPVDCMPDNLNRLIQKFDDQKREYLETRRERIEPVMISEGIENNYGSQPNPYVIRELRDPNWMKKSENTRGKVSKGFKIIDSSRDSMSNSHLASRLTTIRPAEKIKGHKTQKQEASTIRMSRIGSTNRHARSNKSTNMKKKPSVNKDSEWSIAFQKHRLPASGKDVDQRQASITKRSNAKPSLPPRSAIKSKATDKPAKILDALADLIAEKLVTRVNGTSRSKKSSHY